MNHGERNPFFRTLKFLLSLIIPYRTFPARKFPPASQKISCRAVIQPEPQGREKGTDLSAEKPFNLLNFNILRKSNRPFPKTMALSLHLSSPWNEGSASRQGIEI
ncbi:MAG: hypothetical protein HY717_15235 [Planctomycetes bacterium]|nr:hypothetical protein [Planctomycetota bacterium]